MTLFNFFFWTSVNNCAYVVKNKLGSLLILKKGSKKSLIRYQQTWYMMC
jgi:hypothetical protein